MIKIIETAHHRRPMTTTMFPRACSNPALACWWSARVARVKAGRAPSLTNFSEKRRVWVPDPNSFSSFFVLGAISLSFPVEYQNLQVSQRYWNHTKQLLLAWVHKIMGRHSSHISKFIGRTVTMYHWSQSSPVCARPKIFGQLGQKRINLSHTSPADGHSQSSTCSCFENCFHMEVSWNGGTPSYHPFHVRIFHEICQPAIGVPPMTMDPPTLFSPKLYYSI